MITAIQIFLFILLVVGISYYFLIVLFTWGWFKMKQGFVPEKIPQTKVSIVIAVRNEEKNIINLLEKLNNQNYQKELIEVIIVDDHSTDNTVDLIKNFAKNHPGTVIKVINSQGEGKKDAVKTGVNLAKYDFILTTDGDSLPGDFWIERMAGYYEKYKPKLILGPVVYTNEKGFLQKLFSIDFISLVATGAGAAGIGLPFMGNAANMGFEKSIYTGDVNNNFASGDDIFLIHTVKQNSGNKAIHFLKEPEAAVKTPVPENIKEFIKQRLRWGSKAKGYKNAISIITSLTVFIFNTGLLLLFLAGFFFKWIFAVWFLFILFKTLIDFPLLKGFADFSGKSKLLVYVFPMELIYPFYITITGIGALFFKYEWKERKNLR